MSEKRTIYTDYEDYTNKMCKENKEPLTLRQWLTTLHIQATKDRLSKENDINGDKEQSNR